MSIVSTQPIRLNLYIPQPELSSPYPVGEWRGATGFPGDLSGGYVGCIFAPPSAEQARQYLWSWEDWSAIYITNSALSLYGNILLVTAEELNESYGQGFVTNPISNVGWCPPWAHMQAKPPNRIFQPEPGLTNSFGIYIDTNTNAIEYRFAAWGYIWHPNARYGAGGPRRP